MKLLKRESKEGDKLVNQACRACYILTATYRKMSLKRKRQTICLPIIKRRFISGVVSCMHLEALRTRASDHPVLRDLYFHFHHCASVVLQGCIENSNMGAGHSALLSLRYCNGGEPHGSWSVFNDQWSRNPYIVSSFA